MVSISHNNFLCVQFDCSQQGISHLSVVESMFTPAPLQIVLNIYDLHQSNSLLYSVGAGFYHTGVEVNGYEYSFSPSGVLRTRPRLPEFGILREQLTMGTYTEGMSGINAVISTLRNSRFQQGAYDTIHLNCNHFSDAFCLATVHQAIPNWVNRMAGMGAIATPKSSSRDISGGDKMAAPGVVKTPGTLTTGTHAKQQVEAVNNEPLPSSEVTISQTIFSWFGWNSSESSTTSSTNTNEVGGLRTQATGASSHSSNKKKELTEKQKELLAKVKS